MTTSIPKQIFVYVDDELDDGTPVLAVATSLDEIPHDKSGDRVGVFTRDRLVMFIVEKKMEEL